MIRCAHFESVIVGPHHKNVRDIFVAHNVFQCPSSNARIAVTTFAEIDMTGKHK